MDEEVTADAADLEHEEAIRAVREAIRKLDYGSILITIHQGEVVGLEVSSKQRLKKQR